MQLDYMKQIPPGEPPHTLEYEVEGEVLMVTHTAGEIETTDMFDFTGVPDGVLDIESIESVLPVMPILSAEKTDGELVVTVLDWSRDDGEVPVE